MKVGSTVKEIHVEICSACHPFYTGKEKLIDTAGRVDRFKKIRELQKEVSKTHLGKTAKKKKSAAKKLAKEREKIKKEISVNSQPEPKAPAKKTVKKTTPKKTKK